jgi:2-hydroxy-4-carboxymuconate semialdehyde hemiacetal dehydrogenase
MNVCVVGYGMMGVWHSDALQTTDCCLHTLVGRRPEPTEEFARRYHYRKWTTNLEEALADPQVDLVILANPSEQHAETALASLAHGKHTLVEIPIAMNLPDAERIVGEAQQRELTLGVVHPMRVRSEMIELRERLLSGDEHIHNASGRFFIHRLENVGGTGYRRSWTDNLLWHHTAHMFEFGLWMLNEPVRRVQSFMPLPDPRTGIPMDVFVGVETENDHFLVHTGSYYGREKIFESLIVTDRDSYRLEVFTSTLITGSGTHKIESEKDNCARLTRDFIEAVRDGRAPAVTGESVLPAMRALQEAQDQWDRLHGARSIPGRPLPEGAA